MNTKDAQPKPNDQRADVKNPNNDAHQDAQDNRAGQLDPQNPKNQPQADAPKPGKK